MVKNFKLAWLFYVVCLFTLGAINLPASNLHRYHTSLTRIDYNENDKLYEISIRLFTHDLAPLLEKRNGGKRVELEKSAEGDKLIHDYLIENFVLNDKNGAAKTLKWVGRETDSDAVVVYLEADAAETLEGLQLKNTVFFDRHAEQTNIVVCRYGGKKADLLFKVGDKFKEIRETKPPPEK